VKRLFGEEIGIVTSEKFRDYQRHHDSAIMRDAITGVGSSIRGGRQ